MKHSNTRSRRLLGISFVAPLALCACVAQGLHERVVRDRDALRSETAGLRAREAELALEVERLEAANRSLARERVKLMEEVEDLRESSAAVTRRVKELEGARGQLASRLRSREQEIERLRETYDGLLASLESEVEAGRIQVEQLREGLRLNLPSDVLFASGSAELSPGGDEVLAGVAERLKPLGHRIQVEGHTDDRPFRSSSRSSFPSNWELAGARAARVARWLIDAGIDPARVSAVSHGEFHPIAANDTPEGRARNRRIEILLVPEPVAGRPAAPSR